MTENLKRADTDILKPSLCLLSVFNIVLPVSEFVNCFLLGFIRLLSYNKTKLKTEVKGYGRIQI